MFKKPFKQKSQISLKSSEKKKFISELKNLFPALSDEDINFVNGFKENLMKLKVTTVKEELVEIYMFDKVPFLIDLVDTGVKLPTVFMCWKFPHIVPRIYTESFLLNKLQNGADLFYPGVLIQGLLSDTNDIKINQPVYICLSNNKAAMAVGLSLVNKTDILSDNALNRPGKIVKIYHIIGDFLFKLHPEPNVPEMGLPDWALAINNNLVPDEKDDVSNDNRVETSNSNFEETDTEQIDSAVKNENGEKNTEELEKEKLSELLEYCFLKAAKTVPKNSYPMLPATFYANHVLTSVPNGEVLNIKKTKWKKFSAFLQEKSLQGLIKLQPIQRGEFTIAGVEHDHKLIREFIDPYNNKPLVVEPVSKSDKPNMLPVFSVSAATVPFFSKFGLKKNDELTRNDVRVYLNDYIKRENLVYVENVEKVKMDPVLHEIIKGEDVISRADLFAQMLAKMSIRYKLSSTPNVVHKGKMPVIDFEVCNRTGNKKVTVISNLECYGVNVTNFAKELQQKAAASATIVSPTGSDKKGPQVQVQGNQILTAVSILKEKHNINEKFMRGLDKAPKAKKRGNK